ncbi:MAG: hypothetical protein KDC93_08445 [Cyclobacteriaceae bacterium]|jgi:hypothetical protein|nr:hypothetical protein [Cyclobacteriaceae bacterium]
MSQKGLKDLRGYLYVGLGVALGVYSVINTQVWGTMELLKLLLVVGMVAVGVYLIRNQ